jgi:hypothetical protein
MRPVARRATGNSTSRTRRNGTAMPTATAVPVARQPPTLAPDTRRLVAAAVSRNARLRCQLRRSRRCGETRRCIGASGDDVHRRPTLRTDRAKPYSSGPLPQRRLCPRQEPSLPQACQTTTQDGAPQPIPPRGHRKRSKSCDAVAGIAVHRSSTVGVSARAPWGVHAPSMIGNTWPIGQHRGPKLRTHRHHSGLVSAYHVRIVLLPRPALALVVDLSRSFL